MKVNLDLNPSILGPNLVAAIFVRGKGFKRPWRYYIKFYLNERLNKQQLEPFFFSSPFQQQAKIRMMQQKDSDKTDSYWSNLWGKPKEYKKSGKRNYQIPTL